ncbi:hypothetical protein, partial [Vibrio parahaemolyticus]|uniref:hypothetical protein n=1 Tax=Vibrio parahaemolyticus TaxID=670 RepID=UPI001A8F0B7D
DGLLRDGETIDYAAVSSTAIHDLPRSLSDEINERFGVSTQLEVGFRNTANDRIGAYAEFNDDDLDGGGERRVGPPPR